MLKLKTALLVISLFSSQATYCMHTENESIATERSRVIEEKEIIPFLGKIVAISNQEGQEIYAHVDSQMSERFIRGILQCS